jgi:rod shape determining protein RodA
MSSNDGVLLVPTGEIKRKRLINSAVVIGLMLALIGVGLANLYSASAGDSVFYSQIRNVGVGIVAFAFTALFITPRFLNAHAYTIFAATVACLLAVLIIGGVRMGGQRWLVIGPMSFQPSEFAKLTVAIVTARFFHTNRQAASYRLRDLWLLAALVGSIFGLIFPQPDFGTAGVCALIALLQLTFIRVNLKSVLVVAAIGGAMALLGWNFFLHDYQKLRVLNFLNPEMDPTGTGYNALQSLVAIGSGGISGKGYLQGTQTQLQFLPTRDTDFIFSVFAEENGFWGGAALFFAFGALTYTALEIARQSKETFNSLLSIGLAAFIFVEFTINLAMVLGMFPVVGIPLPFFSYGGSSMLSICIALGMLVALDRENQGRINRPHTLNRRAR